MATAPPSRTTIVGAVGRESVALMIEAIARVSDAHWSPTVVLLDRGDALASPGEPARSWSEVLSSLSSDTTVVVQASDTRLRDTARLSGARVVTFGFDPRAEIRGSQLHAHSSGSDYVVSAADAEAPVRLRLLGEQLAEASLAALAAAVVNDVDLATAVAALEALDSAGDAVMQPVLLDGGLLVIDDSASSLPETVTASLKALAMFGVEGRRTIAVLGELDLPISADGTVSHASELHREAHDRIGRLVVRLNIAKLVVVGDGARHIHNAAGLEGSWNGESVLVDTVSEAYDRVRDDLGGDDLVLVKCRDAAGTVSALGPRGAQR